MDVEAFVKDAKKELLREEVVTVSSRDFKLGPYQAILHVGKGMVEGLPVCLTLGTDERHIADIYMDYKDVPKVLHAVHNIPVEDMYRPEKHVGMLHSTLYNVKRIVVS